MVRFLYSLSFLAACGHTVDDISVSKKSSSIASPRVRITKLYKLKKRRRYIDVSDLSSAIMRKPLEFMTTQEASRQSDLYSEIKSL
ncbi:hypothetical protein F4678DRAFT_444756, partial [Xylaria arbuscula]